MESEGIVINVRSIMESLISSVGSSEDGNGGGSMVDSRIELEMV